MESRMLQHLRKQLSKQGIDSPEEIQAEGPTELSERYWGAVSGGFGQIVGFGQAFGQTVVPGGFSQTYFTQNLSPRVGPN